MKNEIIPGCWIKTVWGTAVVTSVKDGWVFYRYRATHGVSGKPLWVANGDLIDPAQVAPGDTLAELSLLAPPDMLSGQVLKLQGPYGTGKLPSGMGKWERAS
jgi:hypothetical protein